MYAGKIYERNLLANIIAISALFFISSIFYPKILYAWDCQGFDRNSGKPMCGIEGAVQISDENGNPVEDASVWFSWKQGGSGGITQRSFSNPVHSGYTAWDNILDFRKSFYSRDEWVEFKKNYFMGKWTRTNYLTWINMFPQTEKTVEERGFHIRANYHFCYNIGPLSSWTDNKISFMLKITKEGHKTIYLGPYTESVSGGGTSRFKHYIDYFGFYQITLRNQSGFLINKEHKPATQGKIIADKTMYAPPEGPTKKSETFYSATFQTRFSTKDGENFHLIIIYSGYSRSKRVKNFKITVYLNDMKIFNTIEDLKSGGRIQKSFVLEGGKAEEEFEYTVEALDGELARPHFVLKKVR